MSRHILWSPLGFRAFKALVAAQYNDVKLETPAFTLFKDNITPEFLKKNPNGKVPVLETPHGCVWESNSVARYVARMKADTQLYGEGFLQASQVDQWLDWTLNELEPIRNMWMLPVFGMMPFDQKVQDETEQDMKRVLGIVERHLDSRTYMVGEAVTLADVVLACTLVAPFQRVFAPSFRALFPNVTRWYLTCANQPQFVAVLGPVKLCEQQEKPAAALPPVIEEKKEPKHPLFQFDDVAGMEKALSEGASIELTNRQGETPLIRAAYEGNVNAIKFFLDRKANIEAKDNTGMTAFMWAAFKGQCEAIDRLAECKADLNVQDTTGKTALMYAARNGHDQALEKLIELGVSWKNQDSYGQTAADYARKWGRNGCSQILSKVASDDALSH